MDDMMTCKKCGHTFDVSLGKCPKCGMIHYILTSGRKPSAEVARGNFASAPSKAPSVDDAPKEVHDPDETRSFSPEERQAYKNTQNNEGDDEYGSRRKRGMSPRNKSLIVAAVVLLAVLTSVIAWMSGAFDFDKKSPRDTMPNVVNYTIETATTILENLGLKVEVQNQHSSSSVGTVIAQSIKKDKEIKKGDKVILTVSLGPNEYTSAKIEDVTVPNVVGKTYDQAVYELGNIGLLVRLGVEQYSEEAEGKVISQNPEKGSILKTGDMVLIILSKGPAPSPSPVTHAILVTAGSGGTVSPKGIVLAEHDEDITFTITPADGYEIREVKVDGADVGPVTSYTFTKVTASHTLYVVFQAKSASSPTPTPTASPTPTPTPSPSQPPDITTPVEE